MEFEYDPEKSRKNLSKHGIDFETAKRLWEGETVELISRNSGNDDERRLVMGIIDSKHWTAITTMRDGRTRIISVRRSRSNEENTMSSNAKRSVTAEKIDEIFDNGDDVMDYFDTEHPIVRKGTVRQQRVTLTMPEWMVQELDDEAQNLAVSRNAIINTMLAERLGQRHAAMAR